MSADPTAPVLAVIGTAFHTPGPGNLEVLHGVAIGVNAAGMITGVHPANSPEGNHLAQQANRVERLSASQRLLPGLVDLHIHAPQWPQLGTGLDLPLEQWLFDYTFPLESRYADPSFAKTVWEHMVPTFLANGTTTAVYFSSIHEPATQLLAETCLQHGQRAYVGRVAMDHPEGTPEWYRDPTAAAGLDASRRSVDGIRQLDPTGLVRPILTPRFIPACSDEMLHGIGELAAELGAPVQTHCSESDWEHGAVLERYGRSDAAALASFDLLRKGTVLAHGDHLGDADLDLVAQSQAGVAHCPLSNSYFANAVFPVRRAWEHGVRVGLGTDVAGGAHPGLLPQCAMAVTVSRMLEDGVDPRRNPADRGTPNSRLDTASAFYLATAGGADVLGVPVGRFAVGQHFDAFVIDTEIGRSGLRRWDGVDSEERLFEKIVRLAGAPDITAVWVNGRKVLPTP